MNDSALLFVYGSLRPDSGHEMSLWLAATAKWEGPAFVLGRLLRVSWYPGLVSGEGRVRGDLYQVSTETLLELDRYEGIRQRPDDEYQRQAGVVERPSGESVAAWIYWFIQPVSGLELLPHGDWLQQ